MLQSLTHAKIQTFCESSQTPMFGEDIGSDFCARGMLKQEEVAGNGFPNLMPEIATIDAVGG